MLCTEIQTKVPIDSIPFSEPTGDEREMAKDDDDGDSSDVPIACIVQQEMTLRNLASESEGLTNEFCVPVHAVVDNDGTFLPTANSENIWAYQPNGEMWEIAYLLLISLFCSVAPKNIAEN